MEYVHKRGGLLCQRGLANVEGQEQPKEAVYIFLSLCVFPWSLSCHRVSYFQEISDPEQHHEEGRISSNTSGPGAQAEGSPQHVHSSQRVSLPEQQDEV